MLVAGVPAYAMLAAGFFILGTLDASSGGAQLMLAALIVGVGNGMSSGIISMMGGDSRRRDCHFAAPPSPFSRCFNRH